jgi:hypothetical protein
VPCDGSTGPLVPPSPGVSPHAGTADPPPAVHARYFWAVLVARIYAILPLLCPVCGNEMRLIACVTELTPVQRILLRIGEPATSPPISPARSPPGRESFDWDQTYATAPGRAEPALASSNTTKR